MPLIAGEATLITLEFNFLIPKAL
ncbi:uncharacterized protein METZ01_LOCUS420286, partial [marine metagenome]